MFDSEQSPQKKPLRWSWTKSWARASSIGTRSSWTPGGEQHPVGQRERQVAGDEHGVERLAVESAAATGHPDRRHHRRRALLQVPQEPELPVGDVVLLLLEGVHRVAVGDEAHDVTGDPPHGCHHPHRLPRFERLLPREVDEGRVSRAGGEPEPHAPSLEQPLRQYARSHVGRPGSGHARVHPAAHPLAGRAHGRPRQPRAAAAAAGRRRRARQGRRPPGQLGVDGRAS